MFNPAKTGQMFGIATKATDLGFPTFVLLTTDNIVLQQQTLERVQNDLSGYCICGENDSGLFIQNALMKPVIIVLEAPVVFCAYGRTCLRQQDL